MTARIEVTSEALASLVAALTRFQNAAAELIAQADHATERGMGQIRVRIQEQERLVERLGAAITDASPDEEEAGRATSLQRELARAEEKLECLHRQEARAERKVHSCQQNRAKMKALLNSATPCAASLLTRKIAQLNEYHSTRPNGHAISLQSSPVASVCTISTEQAIGPKPSIQPETPLPLGFRWIRLGDLPIDAELARRGGALSYEKISQEDLRRSFAGLQEKLLPSFALMFTDRESARRLDAERVWELFFGSDPIYIDAGPAGEPSVSSGLHRILAARELGWEMVPAKASPRLRGS